MRLRPLMGPEVALRLAMVASGPVLDVLFGRMDPWPEGYVSTTTPAVFPPGYGSPATGGKR